MDTRNKTNAEFRQETAEIISRFESRFEQVDARFERIMTELQSLNVSIRSSEKSPNFTGSSGSGGRDGNNKPYMKLSFPSYGGGDPAGWLYQEEQYFAFQQVDDNDKVHLASFHLDGIALQWHCWLEKSKGPMSWVEFSKAVHSRFGATDFEDPSEALSRLKQLTTVVSYQQDFERLSQRVDGLPESFLVGCFIGGLKDEIRLEVKLKNPRSLSDAIGIARLVEERLKLGSPLIHIQPPFLASLLLLPPK